MKTYRYWLQLSPMLCVDGNEHLLLLHNSLLSASDMLYTHDLSRGQHGNSTSLHTVYMGHPLAINFSFHSSSPP